MNNPTNTPAPIAPAVQEATEALSSETLISERQARLGNKQSTADLDAVLQARGVAIPARARAEEFAAHGLAEKADAPSEFRPDMGKLRGNELAPEQTRQFVSSLSLSREMGESVAGRLADVVSRLDAMPPEKWADWQANADKVTLRVVGSQEAYHALVAKAKAALARSGTEFAKKLADHVALRDPALLRMLANSQIGWEKLQAKYGSKK
jgi:hypothetical protein